MGVAWMPHVSPHDKDVVYGKRKVFATFDLSKVEGLPTQRHQNQIKSNQIKSIKYKAMLI
jgi:hypothetical protein